MDFDVVLEEIGEFGRYQKTNYLLICLPVIFAAANSLSYVFTAGLSNHRCFVPECDDANAPDYDQPWVLHAVPSTHKGANVFQAAQCERFVVDQYAGDSTNNGTLAAILGEPNVNGTSNKTTASSAWGNTCPADRFTDEVATCDRWVFESGERTIVNDWLITCPENQWKLALIGTLHFAGIVVGSGAFGVLADRYGRKLIFIFCILFMSITGIGQALSTSYLWFAIFAFLNAVGTSGVYPLAFILGVEMVGPRKRELTGIVLNYFYSVGEALVGLAAWLLRDWVSLQLVISAPPLLFVLYYWFVPESVRWLLAQKNTYKAGKIIRRAAIVNRVVLSDHILQTFEMTGAPSAAVEQTNGAAAAPTTTAGLSNADAKAEKGSRNDDCDDGLDVDEAKAVNKDAIWYTIKTVFGSRILVVRCLILFYIWATNAFVFYGLSLNATNLSGNKYVNFILVCLVEVPGLSIAWVAMNKVGRRWSLALSLLVCAFTCMLGAFITVDYHWLMILMFLMGKMGITASFAIVYVHTAEMLPTMIRSGGVGTMSTVARLGALVAPFVPLLSRYFEPLPLLLFGFVSLFGGLLTLCLPETLGLKLPDTVEESERLGLKEPHSKHPAEADAERQS